MKTDTRFTIVYQIEAGDQAKAENFLRKIGTEQSVEISLELVPPEAISSLPEFFPVQQLVENKWKARISYPLSVVGDDPTQLLNVLFGNISLLNGIVISDVSDNIFNELLIGPSFGIEGIRNSCGAMNRAISSTALKPVGLSAEKLADRAFLFSKGGIDIIKDDHGLTNQQSAPFEERVSLCTKAVRRGEQQSGKKSLYFPNITTSPQNLLERFEKAVELGADGVLVCPQLTGLESLLSIASLKEIPVMAHPAFSGSYIQANHGLSPELYYGKIWRAFGADAVIYPNSGGRFPFSVEQCHQLNRQMRGHFCSFKPTFPVPAGGIKLETVKEWMDSYGNDIILLIGGSLYNQKSGIESAAREFQQLLENYGK
jgi:ribulose-bisphosphate carboxylase large chain